MLGRDILLFDSCMSRRISLPSIEYAPCSKGKSVHACMLSNKSSQLQHVRTWRAAVQTLSTTHEYSSQCVFARAVLLAAQAASLRASCACLPPGACVMLAAAAV